MPNIKEFIKNRSAISDVVGEILMTTIAVVIISSIAVFIFSYDVAADVPRTQVRMNTQGNTIYLEHSGGEFVDIEDLEIVVNVNGTRQVYNSSQIYANLENKTSWELGDRIEINTYSEWNLEIKEKDEVNVYLIDMPSKKVFQNLRLSTEQIADSD